MDPEKLMEMQRQMRRNNEDLADFLKDMDSWENDIKEKDTELKIQPKSDKTLNKDLPPVRNSLDKKRRKKKKKSPKEEKSIEMTPSKDKSRISGYDFRAWDKFDVDKACEEIDDSKDSSLSEYETDEEWEIERKKLLSVQCKEQGNQLFKEGNFVEATEQYTRAIDLDPTNPVLPANRAMALIKQEKYAAAELDCTMAISLDESYLKAYHRRGTARAALQKYADAKLDFDTVLKHDPKSRQAQAEREKVEKILNPPKLFETKSIESTGAGVVKAIYKPPQKRSKKPLRRVVIEEIGHDEEVERRRQQMSARQAQQSATKQRITAEDNAVFDRLIANEKPPVLNGGMKNVDNEQTKSNKLVSEIHLQTNSSKIAAETETPKPVLNGHKEETQVKKEKQDSQNKRLVSDTKSNTEGTSSPMTSPRLPPVPQTSYQFQADWKVLKNNHQMFYQYFKEISPAQYPKLFGQALDSDILFKIFTVLKDFFIPNGDDVHEPLQHLCKVSRFSMTTMFMSAAEKAVLLEIFKHLTEQKGETKELAALRKKYQL